MSPRDMGHVPRNGEYQRLVWDEVSVPREKVCEGLRLLGLDPDKIRGVVMRPDVMEIEEYIGDEDDRVQHDPYDHQSVWTRIRVIPIG